MTSVGTYHVSAGSGPEWVCIRNFIKSQEQMYVPQLEKSLARITKARECQGYSLSSVFSGIWYISSRFCCLILTRSIRFFCKDGERKRVLMVMAEDEGAMINKSKDIP